MAQYIFRLDDICPNMNYLNFCKIRDMFIAQNIKPIIGIIPENKDSVLINQAGANSISEDLFWNEMRTLQNEHGWKIALHGLTHVYTNSEAGILKINKRSEFAGVPEEIQYSMINRGKRILENEGLRVVAFMAPSHSFDMNTITALKKNEIYNITDGISAYPQKLEEVLMVPCIMSWPKKRLFGINTICLHINTWTSKMFERFEADLQKNRIVAIEYPEECAAVQRNYFLNFIRVFLYRVRKIAAYLKHEILKR